MSGRKSAEVTAAVQSVIAGKVRSAYMAAKQFGVAESSILRDRTYKLWRDQEQNKQAMAAGAAILIRQ
jgi:hypothetical protein